MAYAGHKLYHITENKSACVFPDRSRLSSILCPPETVKYKAHVIELGLKPNCAQCRVIRS